MARGGGRGAGRGQAPPKSGQKVKRRARARPRGRISEKTLDSSAGKRSRDVEMADADNSSRGHTQPDSKRRRARPRSNKASIVSDTEIALVKELMLDFGSKPSKVAKKAPKKRETDSSSDLVAAPVAAIRQGSKGNGFAAATFAGNLSHSSSTLSVAGPDTISGAPTSRLAGDLLNSLDAASSEEQARLKEKKRLAWEARFSNNSSSSGTNRFQALGGYVDSDEDLDDSDSKTPKRSYFAPQTLHINNRSALKANPIFSASNLKPRDRRPAKTMARDVAVAKPLPLASRQSFTQASSLASRKQSTTRDVLPNGFARPIFDASSTISSPKTALNK